MELIAILGILKVIGWIWTFAFAVIWTIAGLAIINGAGGVDTRKELKEIQKTLNDTQGNLGNIESALRSINSALQDPSGNLGEIASALNGPSGNLREIASALNGPSGNLRDIKSAVEDIPRDMNFPVVDLEGLTKCMESQTEILLAIGKKMGASFDDFEKMLKARREAEEAANRANDDEYKRALIEAQQQSAEFLQKIEDEQREAAEGKQSGKQ